MRYTVGSISGRVQLKTMKLVYVVSPRIIKEKEQRLDCLESPGYCVRVGQHVCTRSEHYKNPTKHVGQVQSSIIIISSNVTCSLHDVAEQLPIMR